MNMAPRLGENGRGETCRKAKDEAEGENMSENVNGECDVAPSHLCDMEGCTKEGNTVGIGCTVRT
jgi:hypothetical protein